MTESAVHPPPEPAAGPVASGPVAGNTAVDTQYWLCRGRLGACTPPAVAVVLSDILGLALHSHAEVKVRALALGLLAFDLHPGRVPGASGTGPAQGWTSLSAADVAALCASYGVQLDVAAGSVEVLQARLAEGDAVVVCVDTELLRAGGGYGPSGLPGLGLDAGHALVVTGIDAAAGLLYLRSPVDPAGTRLALPLEEFLPAWAAAGDAMLVTALPEDGALDAFGHHPAAAADPWARLGDPVLVSPAGPGAALAPLRRRLCWLPFSFAVTAAGPLD